MPAGLQRVPVLENFVLRGLAWRALSSGGWPPLSPSSETRMDPQTFRPSYGSRPGEALILQKLLVDKLDTIYRVDSGPFQAASMDGNCLLTSQQRRLTSL